MLLALNDNTKAVLSNYIISNLKYSSIYFKVFFNLSSPLKGYRNSVFWSLYERIKLWAANVRKKKIQRFFPSHRQILSLFNRRCIKIKQ